MQTCVLNHRNEILPRILFQEQLDKSREYIRMNPMQKKEYINNEIHIKP